jgi:hypothetical protein
VEEKTPEFCDFDCPFADFPPAETAGICRTMAAVWCQRLEKLVNKNAGCEHRRQSARAGTKPSKRSSKPAKTRRTASAHLEERQLNRQTRPKGQRHA